MASNGMDWSWVSSSGLDVKFHPLCYLLPVDGRVSWEDQHGGTQGEVRGDCLPGRSSRAGAHAFIIFLVLCIVSTCSLSLEELNLSYCQFVSVYTQ